VIFVVVIARESGRSSITGLDLTHEPALKHHGGDYWMPAFAGMTA
jgi:hypothetical protein